MPTHKTIKSTHTWTVENQRAAVQHCICQPHRDGLDMAAICKAYAEANGIGDKTVRKTGFSEGPQSSGLGKASHGGSVYRWLQGLVIREASKVLIFSDLPLRDDDEPTTTGEKWVLDQALHCDLAGSVRLAPGAVDEKWICRVTARSVVWVYKHGHAARLAAHNQSRIKRDIFMEATP